MSTENDRSVTLGYHSTVVLNMSRYTREVFFFFFFGSSFDFATLQVHLFVCNTDEDIRAAFEAGATGVMSDYPSLLSYYLLRNTREECELLTSEVHNTS